MQMSPPDGLLAWQNVFLIAAVYTKDFQCVGHLRIWLLSLAACSRVPHLCFSRARITGGPLCLPGAELFWGPHLYVASALPTGSPHSPLPPSVGILREFPFWPPLRPLFAFVLTQGLSTKPMLAWNLPCSPAWRPTSHPSASASECSDCWSETPHPARSLSSILQCEACQLLQTYRHLEHTDVLWEGMGPAHTELSLFPFMCHTPKCEYV